jgi:F-type H+-transporting ATPase subunit epsilon
MQVELVSPEDVLFRGEATMVVTRVLEGGEIAFMPGHAAYVGALAESHTRVHLPDGRVQHLAVHGGFVLVSGEKVAILSDLAELGEDIDRTRAEQAREQAEADLKAGLAEAAAGDLRRAAARLAASEATGP